MPVFGGGGGGGLPPAVPIGVCSSYDGNSLGFCIANGSADGELTMDVTNTEFSNLVRVITPPIHLPEPSWQLGVWKALQFKAGFRYPVDMKVTIYPKGVLPLKDTDTTPSGAVSILITAANLKRGDNLVVFEQPVVSEAVQVEFLWSSYFSSAPRYTVYGTETDYKVVDTGHYPVSIYNIRLEVESYGDVYNVLEGDAV